MQIDILLRWDPRIFPRSPRSKSAMSGAMNCDSARLACSKDGREMNPHDDTRMLNDC